MDEYQSLNNVFDLKLEGPFLGEEQRRCTEYFGLCDAYTVHEHMLMHDDIDTYLDSPISALRDELRTANE